MGGQMENVERHTNKQLNRHKGGANKQVVDMQTEQ